jgi:hypothetical protein
MNCPALDDQSTSRGSGNRKSDFFGLNAYAFFWFDSDLNVLSNSGEQIAEQRNKKKLLFINQSR